MNCSSRMQRIALFTIVLTVLVVSGMTGCTVKHVNPQFAAASSQKYSLIALGDITADDKLWDPLLPHLRRGMVQVLNEKKAFEGVLDPAPADMPESCLVISGKITVVDKGSEALRWIVGFGAGRAKVRGSFVITSTQGEMLAKYEAQQSYSGGLGIGGAGFVDMEDLMQRFGGTIAEKAVLWSQTGKLE